MNKSLIRLGSLLAALAVILGAFGAHGLEGNIQPEMISTFETGVRYHFYHALAILLTAGLAPYAHTKRLRVAGSLFGLGILLFSGSIYLLATRELFPSVPLNWLGPVTPMGGLVFIIGWGFLFWATLSNKQN